MSSVRDLKKSSGSPHSSIRNRFHNLSGLSGKRCVHTPYLVEKIPKLINLSQIPHLKVVLFHAVCQLFEIYRRRLMTHLSTHNRF